MPARRWEENVELGELKNILRENVQENLMVVHQRKNHPTY